LPKPRSNKVGREIQQIQLSLSSIVTALKRLTPLLEAYGAPAPAGAITRKGRKLKLSPQRRAVLKLQGQYMGYIRNLKPRQKARVKALKASKGFPAAIRMAKQLMA
jgi:hypothetical protein